MACSLCDIFVNRKTGYRPLVCKQITVQSRDIGETGLANRQQFFFLTRANTIREHATLDLLYPTPLWLKNSFFPKQAFSTRVTTGGARRITTGGAIRITAEDA